ncbi:MAG: PD-(D/E)XK nuclease family protein, partial [Clostridia bacterium]|nr:PD-(D/E)XK nuclease family protein [Clostridia bacterium]
MTHSVSVRTLAETYFEGGDLKSSAEALERMQEGLKGHLLIQNAYDARYKAEVPVKHEVTVDGVSLLVQGRVDGLRLEAGLCEVEEIKTTPVSPALIGEDDYPVHWAQAQIYAWILCEQNGLEQSTVRLVYANLEGERVRFERVYGRKELTKLFFTYAAEYASHVKREESWLTEALPSVKQSAFPFDSFRSGQRSFAAAAYRAIQHKTRLLAQAPTGIGKTAAALFPAVKALGEGLTDTVFYLTARTTGRVAAENALALMRKRGMLIRSVSIVAQRKLCPTPLLPCDPELCPRARGHFDRQRLAVSESWQTDALNEGYIQALAEKYSLCPFELTLALCETAQVVICDYNYVFDPKVRLKRFFDRSGRYTLLIDEAHNLTDRAREMYSALLDGAKLNALKSALVKNGEKGSELYDALKLLVKRIGKTDELTMDSQLPGEIIEAAK